MITCVGHVDFIHAVHLLCPFSYHKKNRPSMHMHNSCSKQQKSLLSSTRLHITIGFDANCWGNDHLESVIVRSQYNIVGQNLTQKLNSMVLRVCLCYINHSHMQHFFNVKLNLSMLTHEYSTNFLV